MRLWVGGSVLNLGKVGVTMEGTWGSQSFLGFRPIAHVLLTVVCGVQTDGFREASDGRDWSGAASA